MWNRSVPKISGLPEMSTKNCTYGTSTFPQQLGEIARRQSLSSLTSTSSWWRIATDEGWCIAATVALFVAFAMSLSALEQMTLCDAAAASSTPQDGSVTTASSSSSSSSSTVAALTPAAVATLDFDQMVEKNSATEESLPMYRADELALHDGTDASRRIWMSYGGIIYDVTDFIQNHPGGVEKIIQAAGSSIEPYWYLYRQHYASDLPIKLLERMAVGRLHPDDQDAIDAQMAVLEEEDPYAREPVRNDKLKVHSDTPMNAEVPARLLTESYLTPNDLFYIRHHHPVPLLTASQLQDYRLVVDLTALGGGGKHEYTVEELKALLPRTEVTVTLQCSGNRRGGFNAFQRTSGTPWGTTKRLETTCVCLLCRFLWRHYRRLYRLLTNHILPQFMHRQVKARFLQLHLLAYDCAICWTWLV